jgi:hypothetical protein
MEDNESQLRSAVAREFWVCFFDVFHIAGQQTNVCHPMIYRIERGLHVLGKSNVIVIQRKIINAIIRPDCQSGREGYLAFFT